ncbi:MAG: hypothetical protein E8D45_07900 [Nitrospira sp.]|nr:MAG: hypothetical protein E8D45_07900 [Nitrospira sp.]
MKLFGSITKRDVRSSDRSKAGYVWAGYRDMTCDEATDRDKVRSSRERFLHGLEARPHMTDVQRHALDCEWANCLLMRGWATKWFGRPAEARGAKR